MKRSELTHAEDVMLIHYHQSKNFVEQLRSGPAGRYIEGFADALWDAGYAEITARRHIRAAQHLIYWAESRHVPLAKMDEVQVKRFKCHLPRCRCPSYGCFDRHGLVRGAHLFLRYLRRIHAIAPPADRSQESKASPLLDAFRQWMRVNRNIGEACLYNYSLAIRDLLHTLGDNPSHFDAQALRKFVLNRSRCSGKAKAKTMVTALRTFIRFLITTGLCPVGLDAAIPTLAYWHLSTLPRYLQAEEVELVVTSCSADTAVGIRDRAIVLLLARPALRASDIVHLRLDDIDWKEGWIRVCGKGRRQTRLPLPQEVGEAVIAYVAGPRPPVDSDILFLRSRAPLRGFASHSAISVIVARAMDRADVACPVRGAAHVLRHTAAAHLLESGVEVNVIRAWLGHATLDTTNRYAEINIRTKEEALKACEPPVDSSEGFPRKPIWRDDQSLLKWLNSL